MEARNATTAALRFPEADRNELLITVGSEQFLFRLTESQVRFIAFQAVEKITR